MDNSWRRQRGGGNFNREIQSSRSNYRKPPVGSWQNTVPAWEKKFCYVVGRISWRTFMDNKRYVHLYENILKWDDSAGEEAFHNAKSRFWAEMNGLPCCITSSDPDAYIDEVDWDAEIDPELILDLEREPDPVVTNEDENASAVANSLFINQPIPCTGWDINEEDLKKAAEQTVNPCEEVGCAETNIGAFVNQGWGSSRNDSWGWNQLDSKVDDSANWVDQGWGDTRNDSWGWNQTESRVNDSAKWVDKGWGDTRNDSWGWNQTESRLNDSANWVDKGWGDAGNNSSGWNQGESNFDDSANWGNRGNNGNWGTLDGNNYSSSNRDNSSSHMSRYKTSRFQGDEYQRDRGWRNGRGKKRVSFDYVRPNIDKKPTSRQWIAMKSCQPLNHHGSGNAADNWGWEKPVL